MSEPNNAQHDELERRLLKKIGKSGDDLEIQTFLRDYARFKKQRGGKFFQSNVGYHVSQPPSTFKSPVKSFESVAGYHEFESPFLPFEETVSFSDQLELLRSALHDGTTDCARFL